MGNAACSCAQKKRYKSEPDSYNISDNRLDVLKHPQSTTPYDNDRHFSLTADNNFQFHKSDEEADIIEELPIYKEESQSEFKTPNDDPISSVCFRSELTSNSDIARTTSLFSSEEIVEDEEFPNIITIELYGMVLREFLINFYPINDNIINEMTARSLLLPHDSKMLLSLSSDREKSLSFLSNFVFSEINICKLATFLHVLVTEKSQILDHFNRSDDFFRSVVDLIYYVINLLSLLAECSIEEEKLATAKSLSSMVNINCVQNLKVLKRKSSRSSEELFSVKIYMCGVTFPVRFWKGFTCINQHFHCCQDLTMSSCNILPDDMFDLCQGFKVSGVLRSLDVSSNPITDDGLKHLETLFRNDNSIISLNIACCSLSCAGVEGLLDTLSLNSSKSTLRYLNLSHNDLYNMTEKSVLILTKLSLTSLEMKSVNIRHQRALFQSLKLNYSLTTIDISGNKLFSNDLTYLAAGLAYNACLKRIALRMTGVLKSDCITLNNAFLMNKFLVSIDLSDNIIGDEGAVILKDVLTMKKTLRKLFLRRCGISLQGTLVLLRTASEAECNVEILDLCYNHSPRMSIVVDIRDIIRKIQDLIYHIVLVKDIKILLWGTLDEPPMTNFHSDCLNL